MTIYFELVFFSNMTVSRFLFLYVYHTNELFRRKKKDSTVLEEKKLEEFRRKNSTALEVELQVYRK